MCFLKGRIGWKDDVVADSIVEDSVFWVVAAVVVEVGDCVEQV